MQKNSDMDLEIKRFSELDIQDAFFDSLRASYPEFDIWFRRKADAGESAYVFFEETGQIIDFLYLKIEEEEVSDVVPALPAKKRLKVGTFKLVSRGTRRGERFMKKIMDRAVAENVDEIYVTIFPTEELQYLIHSFEMFGFEHIADKPHDNGLSEYVLVKDMHSFKNNIMKDYPLVKMNGVSKYLLSIIPDFHTKLFPDSILTNESYDLVQDISSTNSIYKIYICRMAGVERLRKGDLLVIYRTSDNKGPAAYRSVATSICTVDEIKTIHNFKDCDDFIKYAAPYSIFNPSDLTRWYHGRSNFVVVRMLYNAAFTKKVIRRTLIEQVGISTEAYWGFCPLNDQQFEQIIKLGQADERYFIH